MDSLSLCRFTQLELWYWAVFIWPEKTRAPYEWGLIFAQLFAGCAVYFRKKKHTHFKIPSHSLFNAALFQLPRQSQHPRRLLEIWTFSLAHNNSSHERTSLSSHIPSVHPCTLISGLCTHDKALWIYLKKDSKCCILDKDFRLLALHITTYMSSVFVQSS